MYKEAVLTIRTIKTAGVMQGSGEMKKLNLRFGSVIHGCSDGRQRDDIIAHEKTMPVKWRDENPDKVHPRDEVVVHAHLDNGGVAMLDDQSPLYCGAPV
ncbi:hypothetical protein HY224_02915, partial [Candidatus Uhrbacteria bacterium]|nr:hypothetical protein [Candidatus Uhrbacteria bacterium]